MAILRAHVTTSPSPSTSAIAMEINAYTATVQQPVMTVPAPAQGQIVVPQAEDEATPESKQDKAFQRKKTSELLRREQAEDRGQVRVRPEGREYHQDLDHSGLVSSADSRDTSWLTVHSYSSRVARERTRRWQPIQM